MLCTWLLDTFSALCNCQDTHAHAGWVFWGNLLTRQFHSVTILKRTQCVYCILPHNSMKNGLIFVYSPQMKIHQNRFRNRSRKRALILNLWCAKIYTQLCTALALNAIMAKHNSDSHKCSTERATKIPLPQNEQLKKPKATNERCPDEGKKYTNLTYVCVMSIHSCMHREMNGIDARKNTSNQSVCVRERAKEYRPESKNSNHTTRFNEREKKKLRNQNNRKLDQHSYSVYFLNLWRADMYVELCVWPDKKA